MNKVFLRGNLGEAPEFRTTTNGKEVASFSLATTKRWKDATGQKKEDVSWHKIICFGNLVNSCKYLDKGSDVLIEGEIKYEDYLDKQTNAKKYITKIIVSSLEIIKGKEREGNSSSNYNNKKPVVNNPKQNQNIDQNDFVDDDIPF